MYDGQNNHNKVIFFAKKHIKKLIDYPLKKVLNETLEPIRQRRMEFQKDIPAIYEMLRKGCDDARAVAADTLADVRRAMKINYFDDKELIEEQARRFAQ